LWQALAPQNQQQFQPPQQQQPWAQPQFQLNPLQLQQILFDSFSSTVSSAQTFPQQRQPQLSIPPAFPQHHQQQQQQLVTPAVQQQQQPQPQQQIQSRPENLPEDPTVPGRTSTAGYLNAGWRDGMMMRTLHARIYDVTEAHDVTVNRNGGSTQNRVASLLVITDDSDLLQISAWGDRYTAKLLDGVLIDGNQVS
jgi:hypothetical protein